MPLLPSMRELWASKRLLVKREGFAADSQLLTSPYITETQVKQTHKDRQKQTEVIKNH